MSFYLRTPAESSLVDLSMCEVGGYYSVVKHVYDVNLNQAVLGEKTMLFALWSVAKISNIVLAFLSLAVPQLPSDYSC